MNRVFIDSVDLYDSFGLYLESKEISAPEVKTNMIDIPGRDGSLDLSDIFGGVKYGDRTVKINLVGVYSSADICRQQIEGLVHRLNGKRMSIKIIEGSYETTFTGRIAVNSMNNSSNIGKISLTALCSPYYDVYRNVIRGKHLNNGEVYHFAFNTGGIAPTGANIIVAGSSAADIAEVIINGVSADYDVDTISAIDFAQLNALNFNGNANSIKLMRAEGANVILGIGWRTI